MKHHLISSLLSIVLGVGLTSCAPDKEAHTSTSNPPAGERLPAPDLKDENQTWSVKHVTPGKDQVWTLNSELSFQDIGNFDHIQIQSTCAWNGLEFTQEISYPMSLQFHLRDFLSPVLLVTRFEERTARCDFQFQASAPSGSLHKFEIRQIEIKDQITADLGMTHQAFQLEASVTQVDLRCGEKVFPALRRVEQMRDLSDFKLEPGIHLKTCRIVARNGTGTIQNLSDLLDLYDGSSNLILTDQSTSHLEWSVFKNLRQNQAFIESIYAAGVGYPLISLNVYNPTNQSLWIEVPAHLPHELRGLSFKDKRVELSVHSLLILQGPNRLEVPAGATLPLVYHLTIDRQFPLNLPWLIQNQNMSIHFGQYYMDRHNGYESGGYLRPVATLTPMMNADIFISNGTLAEARLIFIDALQ